MRNFSKWEKQQLKEIYRNSDCPKNIMCEYCVIKEFCSSTSSYAESTDMKSKIAESYLKLIMLKKILKD